jgi:hypothetical protein
MTAGSATDRNAPSSSGQVFSAIHLDTTPPIALSDVPLQILAWGTDPERARALADACLVVLEQLRRAADSIAQAEYLAHIWRASASPSDAMEVAAAILALTATSQPADEGGRAQA